jgi:hypothetical protein
MVINSFSLSAVFTGFTLPVSPALDEQLAQVKGSIAREKSI